MNANRVESPEIPTQRSAKAKVLIIDDEVENRLLLQETLSKHFDVIEAGDGEEGVRMAKQNQPDLILLDINMPKMDGISACEVLRIHEATRHIPVIMLSALDNEEHRTRAFMKGADDFLGKPFTIKELIARVSSKVRRLEEAARRGGSMSCGNLTLDSQRLEVKISDRLVPLSVLEFCLLKYMVENKEIVLSRQRILEAVWRDTIVTDRTVDAHIACLRKKLGGFDYQITTVYGAGYALKPND